MDDENVPSAVKKERPVVKHRDMYTIRFFPAADYHWAFSKDLELLNKDKIDSFLAGPNRKKGDLRQAYELARDPATWNEEQNEIVRNYEQSLLDAAEEEEENQDQLEEEEDDDDEEATSKKRKRSAGEGGKIRESADKRKKSKVAEAAKSTKSEKPNSSKGGAAAATNGGEDKSEESLDPETKKVKEWRHKVQKAFLGKDGTINADEMPSADASFKTIEEYDGMTAEHLRTTKIGKVMKRVMQLLDIPRDDEFHFKERAEKLCAKWGAIMAGGDGHKEASAGEGSEPAKENGDGSSHAEPEAKSESEAPAAAAESS